MTNKRGQNILKMAENQLLQLKKLDKYYQSLIKIFTKINWELNTVVNYDSLNKCMLMIKKSTEKKQ